MITTSTTPLHIYFLIDRSGSMEVIRSDVIGGFNSFLHEQQETPGECQMTLVLFDSQDPSEVLADARSIAEIPKLDAATFVPRSGTPLYDALGHLVAEATIRAERRKGSGEPDESILFVIFTDGEENSSVEYDRDKIFKLIEKREAAGWTFAYLGANQDAYSQGGRMGLSRGNTQNFVGDACGTEAAMRSASRSASARRAALARNEAIDNSRFFEGNREADEDAQRRRKDRDTPSS